MAIFSPFFLGKIGQKNHFYDILEWKNAFLGYRNKKFRKSKNWHFSKGVNPWFWSKNGQFSTVFFRQYRPGKCLFRYYTTKKLVSRQTISSKNRKIDIFPKGLTYGFGIKLAIFRTLFFFKQNRPGKCFLQYFSKKKRLSWL